jgi:uncharacterized membrane protein
VPDDVYEKVWVSYFWLTDGSTKGNPEVHLAKKAARLRVPWLQNHIQSRIQMKAKKIPFSAA